MLVSLLVSFSYITDSAGKKWGGTIPSSAETCLYLVEMDVSTYQTEIVFTNKLTNKIFMGAYPALPLNLDLNTIWLVLKTK